MLLLECHRTFQADRKTCVLVRSSGQSVQLLMRYFVYLHSLKKISGVNVMENHYYKLYVWVYMMAHK